MRAKAFCATASLRIDSRVNGKSKEENKNGRHGKSSRNCARVEQIAQDKKKKNKQQPKRSDKLKRIKRALGHELTNARRTLAAQRGGVQARQMRKSIGTSQPAIAMVLMGR